MSDDPITPQTTWSQYSAQIYLAGATPVIGSYDHRLIEEKAREATKDNHSGCPHATETRNL